MYKNLKLTKNKNIFINNSKMMLKPYFCVLTNGSFSKKMRTNFNHFEFNSSLVEGLVKKNKLTLNYEKKLLNNLNQLSKSIENKKLFIFSKFMSDNLNILETSKNELMLFDEGFIDLEYSESVDLTLNDEEGLDESVLDDEVDDELANEDPDIDEGTENWDEFFIKERVGDYYPTEKVTRDALNLN